MEFSAEMIAGLLGGSIVGDKNATVHTVSSIEGGKKGALTYLSNPKYEQYIYTTEASIVLVGNDYATVARHRGKLSGLSPRCGAGVENFRPLRDICGINSRHSRGVLHIYHSRVVASERARMLLVGIKRALGKKRPSCQDLGRILA